MFDDYTEGEGEIICPYCGEAIYTMKNDVEFVVTCENCGKSMYVHTIYYAMKDCELNGEEHEFEKKRESDKFQYCKKCGKTKRIGDEK